MHCSDKVRVVIDVEGVKGIKLGLTLDVAKGFAYPCAYERRKVNTGFTTQRVIAWPDGVQYEHRRQSCIQCHYLHSLC